MTTRQKAPSKAESALLEPFHGIDPTQIVLPTDRAGFESAAVDLMQHAYVGFDTESRPTFKPGEVSDGPHVVQLATNERVYLFQTCRVESHPVLKKLLESTQLVKVGFDLKSDRGHLQRKLGIETMAILDLDTVYSAMGYRSIGVRAAVALTLNRKFHKSKHVTTSNWSIRELSDKQKLYAANDAYAALQVLRSLDLPAGALPVTHR